MCVYSNIQYGVMTLGPVIHPEQTHCAASLCMRQFYLVIALLLVVLAVITKQTAFLHFSFLYCITAQHCKIALFIR